MIKYNIGVREITHFTFSEDEDFWGKEIELMEQEAAFQAPQADDLSKIINLVISINNGYDSAEEISDYLNLGRRQGLYYTKAAQLLGLVKLEDSNVKISAIGLSLINSNDKQRNEILKKRVLSLPLIKEILKFVKLQKLKTITIEELTELIENYANLASSTADRRARTIASWFVWIGYAERDKELIHFII